MTRFQSMAFNQRNSDASSMDDSSGGRSQVTPDNARREKSAPHTLHRSSNFNPLLESTQAPSRTRAATASDMPPTLEEANFAPHFDQELEDSYDYNNYENSNHIIDEDMSDQDTQSMSGALSLTEQLVGGEIYPPSSAGLIPDTLFLDIKL